MDQALSEHLDGIERAGRINREANQAVIEGHLAASAIVVAQQAAQAVQRPDFFKASSGAT